MDSIRRQCFSCGELPHFCAVNSIHSLNDFINGYVAVAGCVYMLESVFFLNVEGFGVSDSLR